MECAEQFPLQLIDPISDSTLIWEESLDGYKQTILDPLEPLIVGNKQYLRLQLLERSQTFYAMNFVVWSKANLNKLCKNLTSTQFEGIIITNFSTSFRGSPSGSWLREKVKMCQFSSGNWFFFTKFMQLALAGKRHNTVVHLQKECNKLHLTTAQCFWLVDHNDCSKWFAISGPHVYAVLLLGLQKKKRKS